MFSGKLSNGVHFYGFELDGDAGMSQAQRAQTGGEKRQGWFFALEERVRTPRFGLSTGERDEIGTLSGETDDKPDDDAKLPASARSLSWRHMQRDADDKPLFVDSARTPPGLEGHAFDGQAWFGNSAAMGAITFRQPVRVLMHATAMLEEA